MGKERRSELGSVMTYVITEKRTVLVKDPSRPDAVWKLPGGGIEASDGGIVLGAIREVLEETGIKLMPGEVTFVTDQRRENGIYYPHFCIAKISDEKLDTRKKVGNENGNRLMVADFPRSEVLTMLDFLERHRAFVQRVENIEKAA